MEAELLAAVQANLDDDAARLVYADWLIERGDVRGEILTLQVRFPDRATELGEVLARLPRPAWAAEWPPAFERGFAKKLVVTDAAALVANIAEIRAQHPLAAIELADRTPVAMRGDLLATILTTKDLTLNTSAVVVDRTGKRVLQNDRTMWEVMTGPDGETIVDVKLASDGRTLDLCIDDGCDRTWETVPIPLTE